MDKSEKNQRKSEYMDKFRAKVDTWMNPPPSSQGTCPDTWIMSPTIRAGAYTYGNCKIQQEQNKLILTKMSNFLIEKLRNPPLPVWGRPGG